MFWTFVVLTNAQYAIAGERTLAVCAYADNLPFSNQLQQGFENRIAEIVANELHAHVKYVWVGQKPGGVISLLNARRCDLVLGVPFGLGGILTTHPYYASSYAAVFVGQDQDVIDGLEDTKLSKLRIGLEAIGTDSSNTPVAQAISKRKLAANVTGFTVNDAHDSQTMSSRLVEAVSLNEVDVAFLWGPFAGYYVKNYQGKLKFKLITSDPENPNLVFKYLISMGVRAGSPSLLLEVEDSIKKHREEIIEVLKNYDVPLIPIEDIK